MTDDGHGIEWHDFKAKFAKVGGSWKGRLGSSSPGGRSLYGSSGEGRFRAYSLGSSVKWTTISDEPTGRVSYSVEGSLGAPDAFEVSDPVSTSESTGTTFAAIGSDSQLMGLLADGVPELLAGRFARSLVHHPGLRLTYDGTRISTDLIITHSENHDFKPADSDHKVEMEIVEWDKSAQIKRSISIRGDDDRILAEHEARIHAPGFLFTVFLRWSGFEPDEMPLADMQPKYAPIFEEVRKRMRDHFSKRQEEITRGLVAEWKQDDVYPFPDESADDVDDAKRELFNVVAVQASRGLAGDVKSKKLSLRLLREALETAPGNLRTILSEVLDLPQSDIDDLAGVLERTSLSSIISSSRIVSDRLLFLRSLEGILFDSDLKKEVLERSQLHRILANESWVFGDQFALGVDDKSLSEVLARHLKLLNRDKLNLAHVDVEDRQTAIVDLMLTKTLEDSTKQHHLVVELKRPSKTIGYTERQQIEAYAMAVAGDDRFKEVDAKWDFVLVANRVTDDIRKLSHKRNQPPGLIHDDPEMDLRIWIRHWGGIIEDRRRGLDFIKRNLEVDPSRDEALKVLREKYARYLPEPKAGDGQKAGDGTNSPSDDSADD